VPGRNCRCCYPRVLSWYPQMRVRDRGMIPFVLSFVRTHPLSLLCNFLGAHDIFLGQAWAEGKGELAACRHLADS